MAVAEIYRRQAALVVQALPYVAEESGFGLKGGTAINLFVRELPRVSVDIDLAYLLVNDRDAALRAIDSGIRGIGARLRERIPGSRVTFGVLQPENAATKLTLRASGVQVKVEVSPVLRGTVFPPRMLSVADVVEASYGYAEMTVLSFEDLFAGKMVAALDRQHPRDLFDVHGLLANEGLTDALRAAFVVYLISHNRPAIELLVPRPQNIETEFQNRFQGMTASPVMLDELLNAREALIDHAIQSMPEKHRRFLVSVERGEPDWNAVGMTGIDRLPAVRWKLQNLSKLEQVDRARNAAELERVWLSR